VFECNFTVFLLSNYLSEALVAWGIWRESLSDLTCDSLLDRSVQCVCGCWLLRGLEEAEPVDG